MTRRVPLEVRHCAAQFAALRPSTETESTHSVHNTMGSVEARGPGRIGKRATAAGTRTVAPLGGEGRDEEEGGRERGKEKDPRQRILPGIEGRRREGVVHPVRRQRHSHARRCRRTDRQGQEGQEGVGGPEQAVQQRTSKAQEMIVLLWSCKRFGLCTGFEQLSAHRKRGCPHRTRDSWNAVRNALMRSALRTASEKQEHRVGGKGMMLLRSGVVVVVVHSTVEVSATLERRGCWCVAVTNKTFNAYPSQWKGCIDEWYVPVFFRVLFQRDCSATTPCGVMVFSLYRYRARTSRWDWLPLFARRTRKDHGAGFEVRSVPKI
ncbi:unnamed protein product [Ectocarpus sp. 12 AP-2014]